MPLPYGTDRLSERTGGGVVLDCLHPKGWVVRKAKTATSAEHPGTAVRWDGAFWEVVGAESRPQGGVRYELAPWDEQHAFRVVEDYSEEAEKKRAEERRAEALREAERRSLLLLGILAGHLPRKVQERLEARTGAPGTTLTLASALPLAVYGGFCTVWLIISMFARMHGADVGTLLPMPAMVAGVYLFVESTLRIGLAWLQGRAAGSVVGTLAYAIYAWIHPEPPSERPSEAVSEAAQAVREEALAGGREARDMYQTLKPLLSLLPAADQRALASRFGFDFVLWGRISAVVLLATTLLYFAKSYSEIERVGGAELLVGLPAALLLAEQVVRLARLARGEPAPSVLGRLVRPLSTRLLAGDL